MAGGFICADCGAALVLRPERQTLSDRCLSLFDQTPGAAVVPRRCARCRHRQRLAFRNEVAFYKRPCSRCATEVISTFAPTNPHIIYCYDCWWRDDWRAESYGRSYDPARPFFEQVAELARAVPLPALFQDGLSENCTYVNYGRANKNCYLMLGIECEEVYYSQLMAKCRDCLDCLKCVGCELCHDCVDCLSCYNLQSSHDCTGCRDSLLLAFCEDCSDCMACVGLKHARFMVLNEQLSEADYRKARDTADQSSESRSEPERRRLTLARRFPQPHILGKRVEESTGNYLTSVLRCYECFDLMQGRDCLFCQAGVGINDCLDCTYLTESELCVESVGVAKGYGLLGVSFGRFLQHAAYSQICYSSEHLFGCVGLRNSSYCILNRRYDKDSYINLRQRIVRDMQARGEFGGFFPEELSPFPYADTPANDYYPKVRVDWDKRPWKITEREKRLLEKIGAPLPDCHPDSRRIKRLAGRLPYRLDQRECCRCAKPIQTAWTKERCEAVYCENCSGR